MENTSRICHNLESAVLVRTFKCLGLPIDQVVPIRNLDYIPGNVDIRCPRWNMYEPWTCMRREEPKSLPHALVFTDGIFLPDLSNA